MNELSELNKLNVITKYKRKLIVSVIVVVIFLIIIGVIFFNGYSSARKKYETKIAELVEENERLSNQAVALTVATTEVSIDVIDSEIQDIGEIVTQEYMYTDAGKFSNAKQMFGKDIPLTTKSFLAKWDGSIKAGIKADRISTKLDEESKTITVFLPKAEILSHEIDSESMEILDEKDGLFNSIELENFVEFEAKIKAEMEERAIENGILIKAYDNAQNVIYKLIYTEPVAEAGYSIIFEEADE